MPVNLNCIKQTKHASPPRILVHGGEKVGKSTFFSQAPNPIFIQTEDGLSGIDANAFPLATTFQEVLEALAVLAREDHDYKTVIIDSADWLEKLIHVKVCEDDNVKTIELAGGGYGKGYSLATDHWRNVLRALDYLNKTKNMIVGIICHSVVVAFNDPMHEPYDRYEMKLHQPKKLTGAKDLVCEWADVIGFANKSILISKKGADKKGQGGVVRGTDLGETNKLHLVGTPAYVAGNRYSLPPAIDLNWKAFNTVLMASFDKKEEK